jgi:hypothetical protein
MLTSNQVAKVPGNPPSMAKTQTTSAMRAKMLARQKGTFYS